MTQVDITASARDSAISSIEGMQVIAYFLLQISPALCNVVHIMLFLHTSGWTTHMSYILRYE